MRTANRLQLVLMWHMHQPDYRRHATGEYALPWVYLHAVKDYTDMASHLERHPGVRAVVNLVPVLLDQIEDYAEQFAMGRVRDPLLRYLIASDTERLDRAARDFILDSCFRSNHSKMIAPYTGYRRLHELYVKLREEGGLPYLSGQYFADLLVWYHLAWTGESVRRSSETVARLMAQGHRYTHADRFALYQVIGESIRGLVGRYRRLAESGQVELSATPHHHPMAPVMLDFAVARETQPDAPLPAEPCYPGGRGRVAAQVESARESHAARFGAPPAGMWPAEGAVSTALVELLARHQCAWAASGEGVITHSLWAAGSEAGPRESFLYRPYRLRGPGESVLLFFRDDRLSDMIGFEYAKWFGKDAAQHFVSSLEEIARRAPAGETPVVSVILDGENAWEYYPYNGWYFLDDLYSLLENHPTIRTTTYGDLVSAGVTAAPLPKLTGGSWVYGTFSTWIGRPEKNRAWDLLAEAKRSYDLVIASGRLDEAEQIAAKRQLCVCESSDWFWWFGDYNPSHSVESFDTLYRENLTNLYRLLKLPVPDALSVPISHGSAADVEAGGTMRRGAEG